MLSLPGKAQPGTEKSSQWWWQSLVIGRHLLIIRGKMCAMAAPRSVEFDQPKRVRCEHTEEKNQWMEKMEPVLESKWGDVLHCRWNLFLQWDISSEVFHIHHMKGKGDLEPRVKGGDVSSIARIWLVTSTACDPKLTRQRCVEEAPWC